MAEKASVGGLSYAGSGVDIEAQAGFVDKIKTLVKSTPQEGVLAGIGGFGFNQLNPYLATALAARKQAGRDYSSVIYNQ